MLRELWKFRFYEYILFPRKFCHWDEASKKKNTSGGFSQTTPVINIESLRKEESPVGLNSK